MYTLTVGLGERSYPIYITGDYGNIGTALKKLGVEGKIIVITDNNVDKAQGPAFTEALNNAGFVAEKFVIEAGENSKNLDTISKIYKFLINIKADRKSCLIALGGGVIGDITGFAAATYLRGIDFVQVPTTLLAQADSSVGGKTGVDFEGVKNVIGAFYQPRFVYINVNSLRTLPVREIRAGLAETIKHGIIRDKDFFNYVSENIEKIMNFDEETLKHISRINCSIKANIVEQDEKESGLRAILNFGHTFGHAIESASNFMLLHGECVSIGMVGACKMANYLGMIKEKVTDKVCQVLLKTGLPIKAKGIDIDEVYRNLYHDKKMRKGKLLFILPEDIGKVTQCVVNDENLIKRVLSEILQ
ncbi:MAG TPA: 3-dehydroquinate synthase [Clostridiaceae bacterium]|nr:3-dehydroquinate synthase [Clostridiaceae bacterium]